MMMDLFLKCRVQQQLSANGKEYIFVRYKKDKYHQITKEPEEEIKIKGLYHTTNNYINEKDKESARMVSKPQPMILALYDDGIKIKKDDKTIIDGKEYIVVDTNNINHFCKVVDISLDLVV